MREVYDPVHLTSEEYKERHDGQGVDVQSTIEAPHVYMLGASGGKDSDQLAFVPTQRERLRELQITEVPGSGKTASSVIVTDKMRFMNGDNPSVKFEHGTQKGGQIGCSVCGGDMRQAYEYDYMAYQKYQTPWRETKSDIKGNLWEVRCYMPL